MREMLFTYFIFYWSGNSSDMAYRPNFGGNYDSYAGNNLGYSNVSRGFNKNSFRSRLYWI